MDIKELINQEESYIIEQRRYFHRFPEVSWEEAETTLAIEKQLLNMGLTPVRFHDIPGLYTEIRGGRAGKNAKTILVRADIDALSTPEATGLSFASENTGVMHACGHDCHIAMMLGAARIFKALEAELEGHIKILFQPGEETGKGALECIKRGILDGVDAVYGAHVYGLMEAPYMDVTSGPRMSGGDQITIEVFGEATHGSSPHTGHDALVAAASIVLNLQTYISRMSNALNPLVISLGTIHGGTLINSIPDYVKMEGTVRTHSAKVRNHLEQELREVAEKTAQIYRCTAKLVYNYITPPVENDSGLTAIVKNAAEELFGKNIAITMPLIMASDDFAFFTEHLPGVYINIGSGNKALGYTQNNHSDHFTVDESVLKNGTALCVLSALQYLAGNHHE